ncbi:MAG: hypothetical protein K2N78_12095, partial [Oscillospiraceae bacterium]|nr:hypothetical protein [Oscillospiraceae bacterium]
IMLINMLIVALISHSGESSVAAVNLVSPITGLIMCLFNSISAAGTVVVAQVWGRSGKDKISSAAGHVLWLIFAAGSICCLPSMLFPRPFLQLFYPSVEPVVMEKAVGYLAGCSFSILVFTIYTGVFCILRGLGESRRCLILTIIINVSYLVFSFLLINILDLDIQGSALALISARVLGSASGVVFLFLWKPPVKIRLRDMFSLDGPLLHSIFHISAPFCIEQLFANGGSLIMTMFMAPLGTSAIAAHAVANSLMGIIHGAGTSAGTLSVTVVGRCVGAGEMEAARKYGGGMNWIARVLVAIASIIIYPLMPLLLRLYNPSPEAYSMALRLLLYTLPSLLLFWPLSNTLPNTLRAVGDTVFPSVLSLAATWTIRVALGYWMTVPMGMGIMGVWGSMWIEWAVRALCLQLRFTRGKWARRAVQSV